MPAAGTKQPMSVCGCDKRVATAQLKDHQMACPSAVATPAGAVKLATNPGG
jgi:hypothetical protein